MAPRPRRGSAAPATRPARSAPSVRRHLSPATRAALARTRALRIDLGGVEVLGIASAPPDEHEAPLVLHPLWQGAALDDALVVVSLDELPPRAPHDGHPVLLQLGARAGGYVRARRRRRRRAIGRHTAAIVLGGSVIAAMATLGLASADVATGRTPHLRSTSDAAAVRLTKAAAVQGLIGPPLVAGVHTPRSVTAITTAARSAQHTAGFKGAWAYRSSMQVFVPYPANPSDPFLACTRKNESIHAGGYRAADPGWVHLGAYQFLRSTWNTVASKVGRFDLVGVNPRDARPVDQDWMALYLYRWQGASPWEGRCAGL